MHGELNSDLMPTEPLARMYLVRLTGQVAMSKNCRTVYFQGWFAAVHESVIKDSPQQFRKKIMGLTVIFRQQRMELL